MKIILNNTTMAFRKFVQSYITYDYASKDQWRGEGQRIDYEGLNILSGKIPVSELPAGTIVHAKIYEKSGYAPASGNPILAIYQRTSVSGESFDTGHKMSVNSEFTFTLDSVAAGLYFLNSNAKSDKNYMVMMYEFSFDVPE